MNTAAISLHPQDALINVSPTQNLVPIDEKNEYINTAGGGSGSGGGGGGGGNSGGGSIVHGLTTLPSLITLSFNNSIFVTFTRVQLGQDKGWASASVSSRIANDDNSVGLSAAAQNLLSVKPIIDLVKKIAKLTLFLPETVPLATEEDDILRRIFELEARSPAPSITESISILFGEHVRDSDGRLNTFRFDLAQGKLARIADELDYLWFLTRDSGGDRKPTKPAGKIADPRPSFTKDAGYEKKMDVFFVASTTTAAQKNSKLKSTNKTDDSEDDFGDVIEIDRPDPPAMKDTISQLATLKLITAVTLRSSPVQVLYAELAIVRTVNCQN
ncbi:hypothetical protein B0H14DRAFT_3172555 [Mycena olivaceomarginata]|nr:hypothetical protein B0H14DRAFT_3172555 [Mycena olivaceomarginata]